MYHKKERRSITVLLVLIGLVILFNFLVPYIVKPVFSFDRSKVIELEAFYDSVYNEPEEAISISLEVPRFDVNKVTADSLTKYGLPKGVAQTWIKYRRAVKGFKHVEQIYRIYGIDQAWIDEHADKFVFSGSVKNTAHTVADVKDTPTRHFGKNDKVDDHSDTFEVEVVRTVDPVLNESITTRLDINTASAEQWQSLKGIGPFYSKRIINFREYLGGFANIDQVGETYGLPDSVFQAIRPHLVFSPVFRKIFINQMLVPDLAKHPHISWKEAKWLFNFRKQHGPYTVIEDLYQIKELDTMTIMKITPYIDFGIQQSHEQND